MYIEWLAEPEEKLKKQTFGRRENAVAPGIWQQKSSRPPLLLWNESTAFIVLVPFSAQEAYSGDRMISLAWVKGPLLGGREGQVIARSFKTKEYVIPKENWENGDLKSKGKGKNAGGTSTVDILRQLIKVWLLASYPRLTYEVDILREF